MAEGKVDVSSILSPFTTREVCFSEENFDKLVKLTDYNVLNNEKLIIQALRLAVARRKQRNYQPPLTSFNLPRDISWVVYYVVRSRCLILASDTCSRNPIILRTCWTPSHLHDCSDEQIGIYQRFNPKQTSKRQICVQFCYLVTLPIDIYIYSV